MGILAGRGGEKTKPIKANFKCSDALPMEKVTAEPCTAEHFNPI